MSKFCDILHGLENQNLHSDKNFYYALIDSAHSDEVYEFLYDSQDNMEVESLFQGDVLQDLPDTVPYLIKLSIDHKPTEELFERFWDKNYFYIVISNNDLVSLRRHLRKFNLVYDSEDNSLLFRYYDPSVLEGFLTVATDEQKKNLFRDQITAFIYKDNDSLKYVTQTKEQKLLDTSMMPLG